MWPIDELGIQMAAAPAAAAPTVEELGVHAASMRRNRRILGAGAAILLATAIAVPLLLLNSGDSSQVATDGPTATATPDETVTPTPTPTPVPDDVLPLTATIGSPLDDTGDPTGGVSAEQRTEGTGWRLLTVEDRGEPFTSNVALDTASYEQLWTSLGLTGPPIDVDFEREIVIHLGTSWGSGCDDLRLEDVVFDLEQRLVYGEFVLPGASQRDCGEDLNARAYMVTAERVALPESPFRVQVTEEILCPDCDTEVTVVDLSTPPPPDDITSTYRLLVDAPEFHPGPVTRELSNGDLESRWSPTGCPDAVDVTFAAGDEVLDTSVVDRSQGACAQPPYESILTITPERPRPSYAVFVDESGLVSRWSWSRSSGTAPSESPAVTRSADGLKLQVTWLGTACDTRPGFQVRGPNAASLTVAIGSGEPVAPCPDTTAVAYELEVTFTSRVEPIVQLGV